MPENDASSSLAASVSLVKQVNIQIFKRYMFIPSVKAGLPLQNLVPSIFVQFVVEENHRFDPPFWYTKALTEQRIIELLG